MIYASGQKFDKSFNEAAYTGAEHFKAETGVAYLEVAPQDAAQFEQAVASLVRRGATDVVAVGFNYATPLAALAPRHPGVRFTLIDAELDQPNVQSVTFRENEGSFLVGMLAAMKSASGKVGFVGAMDIPLIRRFIAGYAAGARQVRGDVGVLVNFVGTTPAAFSDPATAAEVTRAQIERGADVVFAGAGISNVGIFRQAAAMGKLAIGVDSNQNHLQPGAILTSMLKRVDLAVAEAFSAGRDGSWRPGVRRLGLKEDGVGYALDADNAPLLTPDMIARVEAARHDIIDGRLRVPDSP